jgi:hypothetical protein
MGYLMYAEVETSNVEVVPETTTIMPQHVIPPYQLPAAK